MTQTVPLRESIQQHYREEVFFASLSDGQLQFLQDLLVHGLDAKRVQLAVWNREDEKSNTIV